MPLNERLEGRGCRLLPLLQTTDLCLEVGSQESSEPQRRQEMEGLTEDGAGLLPGLQTAPDGGAEANHGPFRVIAVEKRETPLECWLQ